MKLLLHIPSVAIFLFNLWAFPAFAQDLDMVVRHTTIFAGADGVKRTNEFAERVVRRQDQIWIERMVPEGWHPTDEHAHVKAGHDHRHLDVVTASRWLVRGVDGSVRVRLAAKEDKVLVDVAKTEYSNIGFDGSWTAAYYLIDPDALKRMKLSGIRGDLSTYTNTDKNRQLKIVWNDKFKVPTLVESVSGASSKRTVIEVSAPVTTPPWKSTQKYVAKDYSDYLD